MVFRQIKMYTLLISIETNCIVNMRCDSVHTKDCSLAFVWDHSVLEAFNDIS